MATPSRDNSPQRAPLLIRRSLTTVIRRGLCYSIELHVVAQEGRCPAVGKFPCRGRWIRYRAKPRPRRRSASGQRYWR
jgi:hypothetical protein